MFDYTFLQVILYQAVIDVQHLINSTIKERPLLNNIKYTVY